MRSYPLCAVATFLILAACEETPERVPPKDTAVAVQASVETAGMPDSDDAADDPAIWVNPTNPERSLIIATNKRRGLVIYDLEGKEIAKRDDGRINNVDLRQNVVIGEFQGDLVAATNRTDKSIAVYSFDGTVGALTPVLSIPSGFNDPYGLCMYRNPATGVVYIFANNSDDGMVAQWLLTANGATLEAKQVRSFGVGSQAEGCVADDENGVLFIAEEDVGLYAYWAEPELAKANKNGRLIIDTVSGGHLTADAEGVALLKTPDGGGYVIASSQGSNSFNVYDRASPYTFRGAFVIGPNVDAGIDGVEETDGIDVTATPLGGEFAEGVFVAQDGFNYEGADESRRANQNFKLVPWRSIRQGLALPDPVGVAPSSSEPSATPN